MAAPLSNVRLVDTNCIYPKCLCGAASEEFSFLAEFFIALTTYFEKKFEEITTERNLFAVGNNAISVVSITPYVAKGKERGAIV